MSSTSSPSSSNYTVLADLSLHATQVSDAGLVHLRGLTNLTELSLSGTKVSDAGLAHLKGLTNLSRLALRRTDMSDAGLVHLKGLTNLSRLKLDYNTEVTADGMKALKQALPRVTIDQSF
jgi:internalin A